MSRPRPPAGGDTPRRSPGAASKRAPARTSPRAEPPGSSELRDFDELLIEITDAIVVHLDTEGKIRYVNHAFEEITGYTLDDLKDRDWFEVLVPRTRYPQVWQEFERLTTGGLAVRFENPILTKAGEERYIVWRNSTLRRDGETTGTISIGIDISERKRAEEALADSEQKLLAVFTSSPAGMAVTKPEDGLILDVNEEFMRMFECSYEEVLHETSVELGFFVNPDDRRRFIELLEKQGQIQDFELAMRSFRGKELTVSLDINPVTVGGNDYLISSFTDIAERKRAEAALRESEEKLRATFMAVPAVIIVSRLEDGLMLDVNREFERLYECPAAEAIGKTSLELGLWADPADRSRVVELIESEGRVEDFEVKMRTRGGRELTVLVNAGPVPVGGERCLIFTVTDIGQRKQAEEQLTMLKHSIDVNTDGAFWMNTNNELIYVNDAACWSLGFEREELLGKNVELANPSATPERMEAVWKLLRSKGSFRQESVHKRKDGSEFPVEITSSYVEFGGEEFICGFARDIGERKRSERALTEATHRFVSAFENSPVGMAIVDLSGNYVEVNPTLCRLLGYSREQLLATDFQQVTHPEDREIGAEYMRGQLEGAAQPHSFEKRYLHSDGHPVWVRVLSSLVRDELGQPLYFVTQIEDVSEHKLSEDALRDSEEKLRAIYMSVPAGIAVTDLESGRIFEVNEEYERIFNIRREELFETTSLELGLWEKPGDRDAFINLVRERGEVDGLEYPMRRIGGGGIVVSLNARVLEVSGSKLLITTVNDISERKRAEEEIELLSRAVESHYDAAFRINADNIMLYVNEAAYRSLGYEREELIGQPNSFVNPRATPEAMSQVWDVVRREGNFSAESRHRRKDGSEFPVDVRTSYLRHGDNEYQLVFARDITLRKLHEAERERLAEQVGQAQKLEAIGKLAGGVAHSFNNILTAIIGYCELLLARLPADSEYRTEAEEIKRAADHATTVTRELLIFSRREAGTPVRLDLNTVIVQTRLLLHQILRSDIEIVTALAPTVNPVRADRSQIEQVLVNLAMNASDAMPSGGVLALETKNIDLNEELVDGSIALAPGRYVAMTVKDSGVGMDEETLARIFEPFFSTKPLETGTGLGLSTVYGIVEESGGQIAVESRVGSGSRVTIYLPALPSHS